MVRMAGFGPYVRQSRYFRALGKASSSYRHAIFSLRLYQL